MFGKIKLRHVRRHHRFTTKFTNGVRTPRFVNNLQCRTKVVRLASVVRLWYTQ